MNSLKLLFIDACQRGENASRTYAMAKSFIRAFENGAHGNSVETVTLRDMELAPLKADDIIRRDELIDAGKLDHGMFALANRFAQAKRILIAAPYWDLMFPSALKVYIEHIMVRKITFVYGDKGPIGLGKADKLAYLTSSGSPIGDCDFGSDYIRAIGKMTGINGFYSVSAEGLDIIGFDAEAILARACEKAAKLGAEFGK